MSTLKKKLITKIENKIIEYKQIDKIEKENKELQLVINQIKDNEFIYNPEFPNYNTPFMLIDFDEITSINTNGNILIARTLQETYTLNMKSDEYFFEFIKNLLPVGVKTLVGKERLMMKSDYYDFNINLTESVDIVAIKKLLYRVHGKPKKIFRETAISNNTLSDNKLYEKQQRLVRRYGGWISYSNRHIKVNNEREL